jgi:hypothetical protein
MVAKRLVRNVSDKPSHLLRKKIQSVLPDPYDVAALLKDVHLLELALSYGSAVISSDDRSGRLAKETAAHYNPLRRVQWVSPHDPEGACRAWLESGLADPNMGILSDVEEPG